MGPICRSCYLASLTPDERDRATAEPLTSTIHLCADHQTAEDRLLARIDWSKVYLIGGDR